jgi:hypothetical protein
MKRPVYKNRPIASIKSLSKALGCSQGQLLKLASEADKYYFPNKPTIKPNGKIRQTYRVGPYLKNIQKRIIQQIFLNVDYPPYLQGSIKNKDRRRDYITDTALHTGKKTIISMDVRDCFPSIKVELVEAMWQCLFNFSEDVAGVLAQLTTYKGFVPQGSPTSSYIANLIFWSKEPQVEYKFSQLGFTYSRYVDDITISTDNLVDKEVKSFVIAKICGMLKGAGLKPNRSKIKIQTRFSKVMVVHHLNVSSERPTHSRKKRARVRAAVRQCEDKAKKMGRSSEEYKQFYNSVAGRVEEVRRLHGSKGNKVEGYRLRLQKIKPIHKT